MNSAAEYLNEAELSLAAYAALPLGVSGADFERALALAGMSTTQAKHFASTYTVVTQYNDLSNGLSATVFSDASGNKYLAVRGTDDGYDLLTDAINVALLGTTKYQSQYTELKAKVAQWIGNGTLGSSFTVTGHSLGGFLATGIAADFPLTSRMPTSTTRRGWGHSRQCAAVRCATLRAGDWRHHARLREG